MQTAALSLLTEDDLDDMHRTQLQHYMALANIALKTPRADEEAR